MASSRFVLKGIEDMLKEEVKFFSMVRQNGERMYICLGKRALYLLDFEPPMQQQFYFAWIQTVIIDRDNLLLFQVDFHEGRPSLLLESFERSRLCDELAICWKADSMFRQWRWQPFPLKKGQCELGRRDRARTAVALIVEDSRSALAPATDLLREMSTLRGLVDDHAAAVARLARDHAMPPTPKGDPLPLAQRRGRDWIDADLRAPAAAEVPVAAREGRAWVDVLQDEGDEYDESEDEETKTTCETKTRRNRVVAAAR